METVPFFRCLVGVFSSVTFWRTTWSLSIGWSAATVFRAGNEGLWCMTRGKGRRSY